MLIIFPVDTAESCLIIKNFVQYSMFSDSVYLKLFKKDCVRCRANFIFNLGYVGSEDHDSGGIGGSSIAEVEI